MDPNNSICTLNVRSTVYLALRVFIELSIATGVLLCADFHYTCADFFLHLRRFFLSLAPILFFLLQVRLIFKIIYFFILEY